MIEVLSDLLSLGENKFIVETLLCNQFRMSALLSDTSVVKYHNTAGILYCRQAMGNDETRSALLCLIQGLLHNLQEQDKRSNQNEEDSNRI